MKPFPHIDKTAPRVTRSALDILRCDDTGRYGNDISFYIELKDKYPNLRKYSNKAIKNHIISFNRLLVDKTLEHIDGIVLPSNMGHIMICTIKKLSQAVDLKTSDELGVVVHYENAHSDGHTGAVYYTTTYQNSHSTKMRNMYQNWRFWYFTPDRNFRQGIAREYKTSWKKYRVRSRYRKIQSFIDREVRRNYIRNKVERLKKDYNEFDI